MSHNCDTYFNSRPLRIFGIRRCHFFLRRIQMKPSSCFFRLFHCNPNRISMLEAHTVSSWLQVTLFLSEQDRVTFGPEPVHAQTAPAPSTYRGPRSSSKIFRSFSHTASRYLAQSPVVGVAALVTTGTFDSRIISVAVGVDIHKRVLLGHRRFPNYQSDC